MLARGGLLLDTTGKDFTLVTFLTTDWTPPTPRSITTRQILHRRRLSCTSRLFTSSRTDLSYLILKRRFLWAVLNINPSLLFALPLPINSACVCVCVYVGIGGRRGGIVHNCCHESNILQHIAICVENADMHVREQLIAILSCETQTKSLSG